MNTYTPPPILTDAQREDLRQINLAQIWGYKQPAQLMLAQFFTAYPTLKSLYLRDYPQGDSTTK